MKHMMSRPLMAVCVLAGLGWAAPDRASASETLAPPQVALGAVMAQSASGETLTLDALAERLAAADLVVIGETHDNPLHHEVQAYLTARLAAMDGGVKGLAFEMVPEAREEAVNAARVEGRKGAALAEAIGWSDLGWPDFRYYEPIFAAAPEAYVAGAQPAREQLMSVARDGLETAPEAVRFGLDQPLEADEQATREAAQIEAHCNALPAEMAPMLVGAQRFRDARFAEALLRAHERGRGRAVLITGSGHARTDWGAPRQLRRLAPELTVLSVGQREAPAPGATEEDSGAPFDFVIVTPSRQHLREDPCKAFQKG